MKNSLPRFEAYDAERTDDGWYIAVFELKDVLKRILLKTTKLNGIVREEFLVKSINEILEYLK